MHKSSKRYMCLLNFVIISCAFFEIVNDSKSTMVQITATSIIWGIVYKYLCCNNVHHGVIRALVTRSDMSWWRHQMETFSALLAICAENSPVPGEFPAQRPVTRRFDVFFDLRLNKRLSKQSWGWWFETPSRPLRRHRNVVYCLYSSLSCSMPNKIALWRNLTVK